MSLQNNKVMKFIIGLFLLSFGLIGFAQTPSEAEILFNQRKYEDSAVIYAKLLEKKPSDPLYNYRYARCLYEMQDYQGAINYFVTGGDKYPLRDYYLADSYFLTYHFSEAIEYFNTYMTSTRVNVAFVDDVLDKLRRSRIAFRLMNRVEDIAIIDSMVVNQQEFLTHYRLSKGTGQLQQESHKITPKGIVDLISFITQRGDRKIYSDMNGSKINLFAANKLLDGWSIPERLSDNVNIPANNVNYPFLRLDGLTLFFASDGENSIGGYDIFITRFAANTNDYLNPENIGMPFNSLYNDYMLVIDESNQTGWFASDRYQQNEKVIIYQFRYKDEKAYVPVEDQDYLLKAAQLKISRKELLEDTTNKIPFEETKQPFKETKEVDNDKTKVSDNNKTSVPDQEIITLLSKEMKFEVNDQLTYTNTTQFKSSLALKLWNEFRADSDNLDIKVAMLKKLRNDFDVTNDLDDRKILTQEIVALEKSILKSKLLLEEQTKNIRVEELNFINLIRKN